MNNVFTNSTMSKTYQTWRELIEPFLNADYRKSVLTAGEVRVLISLTMEDYQLLSDVKIQKRKIKLRLL